MKKTIRTILIAVLIICIPHILEGADRKVIVMGDSTMLSMRSPKGEKLSDFIGVHLKKLSGTRNWTVINAGIGGETAQQGAKRIGKILAQKPDILTLSYGLNDTCKSTPEIFKKSLESIIEKAKKQKVKVILFTSTPFDNNRHSKGKNPRFIKDGLDETMNSKFLSITRKLAADKKCTLCDLHSYFHSLLKKKKHTIKELIRGDGVHLTKTGNDAAGSYAAMAILGKLPSSGGRSLSWRPPKARQWRTVKYFKSAIKFKGRGRPVVILVHRTEDAGLMTKNRYSDSSKKASIFQICREVLEQELQKKHPAKLIRTLSPFLPKELPEGVFIIMIRDNSVKEAEIHTLKSDDPAEAWDEFIKNLS